MLTKFPSAQLCNREENESEEPRQGCHGRHGPLENSLANYCLGILSASTQRLSCSCGGDC